MGGRQQSSSSRIVANQSINERQRSRSLPLAAGSFGPSFRLHPSAHANANGIRSRQSHLRQKPKGHSVPPSVRRRKPHCAANKSGDGDDEDEEREEEEEETEEAVTMVYGNGLHDDDDGRGFGRRERGRARAGQCSQQRQWRLSRKSPITLSPQLIRTSQSSPASPASSAAPLPASSCAPFLQCARTFSN